MRTLPLVSLKECARCDPIATINVRGMNDGANDPDANYNGGDGDGNGNDNSNGYGDDGVMLASKLVCILLTQEFLGCSWQIERGGIHSRFSNHWVHAVYGRRKSNTAILDAIITDKQANIVRF